MRERGYMSGGADRTMKRGFKSRANIETVKCRRCGNPTFMTGSKLCDRCWDLETRIRMSPEIAMAIIKDIYGGVGKETRSEVGTQHTGGTECGESKRG